MPCNLLSTLRQYKTLTLWVALLLAVLWVPSTSHDLLVASDIIHHTDHSEAENDHHHSDSDSQGGPDHEAADGQCRLDHHNLQVKTPSHTSVWMMVWVEALFPSLEQGKVPNLIPIERSHAPPELVVTWQFVRRTALPPFLPSVVV